MTAQLDPPDDVPEPVLRQANLSDSEFCFTLHRAAMGAYVAEVWGWDEDVQRRMHDKAFDPRRRQIVTVGGEDVGVIDVERRLSEIYLARIEILPEHQGRGIGAILIRALITEAGANGMPLTLDVLSVNGRARALYRRLGLRESVAGEPSGGKIHMSTTTSG